MRFLRVGQETNNTHIVESTHEMISLVVILNTVILKILTIMNGTMIANSYIHQICDIAQ